MSGKQKKYFVVRLSEQDPEWAEGYRYEIQILDSQGRGAMAGYLKDGDEVLEIEGRSIPSAVIGAARGQAEGQGDYVDSEGRSIAPF